MNNVKEFPRKVEKPTEEQQAEIEARDLSNKMKKAAVVDMASRIFMSQFIHGTYELSPKESFNKAMKFYKEKDEFYRAWDEA